MRAKAFTLIELLIVVAIIAILAAIAVPNFLEAQTRAKVSRTQADMRSLATGLESYIIDWNRYPPALTPTAWKDDMINGPSVFGEGFGADNIAVSARFIPLTTPTAYITSVFPEVFRVAGLAAAGAVAGDEPEFYDTFDYVVSWEFQPEAMYGAGRGAALTSGGAWRVSSVGPDRIQAYGGIDSNSGAGADSPNALGADYDPTNGTISAGDIVRVGASGEFDPANPPAYNRVTGEINI